MAIGGCIIDTVDLAAYGIFIERGGSDDFLSFPERRIPDFNDWEEYDGLDVDLSELSFEAKKVQVKYVVTSDDESAFKHYLNSFEALHFAPGYRSVFVREFNRTFQLRFTGFSSYSHKGGLYMHAKKMGKITAEYSMDDPLQFFTPAILSPISTRETLSQIALNGYDLSRFGIIVRDIYSTALRSRSAKPVLERKINHITGLAADTGLIPKRQARIIEIQCAMIARTFAEFMTNWNALFNNLRITVPVQLGVTRTGSVLNCYYSKMTNFKKEASFSRKVKVSFNLILQEI